MNSVLAIYGACFSVQGLMMSDQHMLNSVLAIYGACLECTGVDKVRSTYEMSEQVSSIYGDLRV